MYCCSAHQYLLALLVTYLCCFSLSLSLSLYTGEWITGATCMYIIDYLVSGYGQKDDVTEILNSVELVTVPFVNPDGYVVSSGLTNISPLTSLIPGPFPAQH